MHPFSTVVSLFYIYLTFTTCSSEQILTRTKLDSNRSIYRQSRLWLLDNLIGRTGIDPKVFKWNLKRGKVQKQFNLNESFFCDENGAGSRSSSPPTSVHKLRPGDIDIIGAFGDSLTAGNGAFAQNVLQVLTENKGVSWTIGGQATWRQFLTIPNMIKVYNPNLYGFSLNDGISTDKSAKFNVGEIGAMSRDITWMVKILVQRMRNDKNVDFKNHWKLVSVLIGSNDFCSDVCFRNNPEKTADLHEQDLITALRYLRDNLPRTIVNLIVTPSMKILTLLKGKPQHCHSTHYFECPCFFGLKFSYERKRWFKIIEDWKRREFSVADREEFHNKLDFTVTAQPFLKEITWPKTSSGISDVSYMSMDCFHMSQKGYARAVNSLWNNMFEPWNNKSTNWNKEFENVKCPTNEMPFIRTKFN